MDYFQNANETAEWLLKSEEMRKINRNKFLLKNFQCPGDVLMLTACVRDIKRWYPELEIGVETSTLRYGKITRILPKCVETIRT
jgi:hypothetical protein